MTGATGGLASVLLPKLDALGQLITVARHADSLITDTLNLSNAEAVLELVKREQPDVIIHLAALTDVDQCEKYPALAWKQNVCNTRNLVEAVKACRLNPHFVYASTDMVYDGNGVNAERDTHPGNVYALTKLWGEDIAGMLEKSLILRLNFFGVSKKSGTSLTSWLKQACLSDQGATLFSDVMFSPLFAEDLADAIVALIAKEGSGVVNLGCRGNGVSKADFLRRVATEIGLPTDRLRDGSVKDVALAAYRPRDMRMDVSKVEKLMKRKLPTIDETIGRFVKMSANLRG
ncbi:SDR family oxidoreductase [Thalassospira povalilytica]|uniref:SDR family oxidoreductase n=1 Tax=Thalassospira povalilytica TaxID=732237 RepID=UPI003AA9CB83